MEPDTSEPTIRLRGVVKEFGKGDDLVRVVDGIDLDIGRGEIVALLGPNGAGKTTTLDLVLGFDQPTSGTVRVLGSTAKEAVLGGRVSAVLQTGGLLRDLTVAETVQLIASVYPDPPPVADVMQHAGLTDLAARLVQSCSGGEQQRLRFALALLADPELLVLDEPTAGMDVQARHEFWATMRAEAGRGRTIVFATHYLQEAEDFAQRTVLIANGRLVADGPTEQLRRHAAGRTVRARFAGTCVATAEAAIRAHDSVNDVRIEGDQIVATTSDSDRLARLVLGDLGGHDLEISAATLEAAFVQLTRSSSTTAVEGVLQ